MVPVLPPYSSLSFVIVSWFKVEASSSFLRLLLILLSVFEITTIFGLSFMTCHVWIALVSRQTVRPITFHHFKGPFTEEECHLSGMRFPLSMFFPVLILFNCFEPIDLIIRSSKKSIEAYMDKYAYFSQYLHPSFHPRICQFLVGS